MKWKWKLETTAEVQAAGTLGRRAAGQFSARLLLSRRKLHILFVFCYDGSLPLVKMYSFFSF